MKYDECLQVLSPARLNKYAQASGNEKAKTLRLYQYNIKLSQRFYRHNSQMLAQDRRTLFVGKGF